MRLTYIGHSTFQIDTEAGTTLLIDPWIEGNPHTDRAVESFDDVDAVLVTHGAHDHLGDAPAIVRANDAPLLCDPATATVLSGTALPEGQVHPFVWGAVHEADDWSAKILEARHLSWFPDQRLIGPAQAYVITADGERVYHMGDTSIFRSIELFGELYDPTVALIPVGQAEGEFTELHPDEAALVAEWLEADVAVPMHYYPGSHYPESFREHCRDRGVGERTAIRPLGAGEHLDR